MSVTNGRSLTRSEHRHHDRLLVTRVAMGDAYPGEGDEAAAIIEKCADCAALAADVKLIASSVSRLPVARRTRDFMITDEQAEKLRGGRVSRWLRSFGTPGWAMVRPLAGVTLSIGLVMALVGAGVPGMQPASQTFGEPTSEQNVLPSALPEPAGTAVPVRQPDDVAPPQAGSDRGGLYESATQDPITEDINSAYVEPSPEARQAGDVDEEQVPAARVDTTRDTLAYGGLAIATLSFALLALAVIARRRFVDPLLR